MGKRKGFSEYSELSKRKGFPAMKKAEYESLNDDEYKELGKALEIDNGEDSDDDDDEEGEPEEKSENSSLAEFSPDEEELIKSMELLEATLDDDPGVISSRRREMLAAKAASGTLEKSERNELFALLSDQPEGADEGEDLSKALREDDSVAQAYDASEFLAAFGELFAGRQESLEKSINERDRSDSLYKRRLVGGLDKLAKALVGNMAETRAELGALRKSMESIARTPMGWTGKTQVQPEQLIKSHRDKHAPTGLIQKTGAVTKRQAQSALDEILEKSSDDGDNEKLGRVGSVLTNMAVRSPSKPWAGTPGMTAELAEEILGVVGAE